jgi:hypothetical protein
MEPNELLGRVVQHLDALDIPYLPIRIMSNP